MFLRTNEICQIEVPNGVIVRSFTIGGRLTCAHITISRSDSGNRPDPFEARTSASFSSSFILACTVNARSTMDPLSIFPLEISLNVLKHIELEELLLSTRKTCRSWNRLVTCQLPHLMVASYFVRIEFSRIRFDLPLRLRVSDSVAEKYVLGGCTTIQQELQQCATMRPTSISAGIVNQGVNRTFMSNHSLPVITHCPDVKRVEVAVDRVDYSSPTTNTGKLTSINLKIRISSIPENVNGSASQVEVSIDDEELAKWIVQCRLAQGYRTPGELHELASPRRKFGGIIGPYQGFQNSGGIWSMPVPGIRTA